jgi:hypothetical protein
VSWFLTEGNLMLQEVFTAFVEQSPVSVMMRALVKRIFRPERLDEIFETHAKVQYTRELLFSTLVNLLSLSPGRHSPRWDQRRMARSPSCRKLNPR